MTICSVAERVVYIVVLVCAVLCIVSWIKGVRAFIYVVRKRKPGISIVAALSAHRLWYDPSGLGEESDYWISQYWRNLLRFLAFWAVAFASGMTLQGLCGGEVRPW
jgi:hypothetical protein